MRRVERVFGAAIACTFVLAGAPVLAAMAGEGEATGVRESSESARMARAKDLISEDQWVAAIAELRAAVTDPRESSKDEALFWLAHSQNQVGDLAEAVESIRRLQREFEKSRWSAPAYSLLIELAQKLGRRDVLWKIAPPAPPVPPPPPPAAVPRRPGPRAPRAPHLPPAPPAEAAPPPAGHASDPPAYWVSDTFVPDTDLRIQALGRLIPTDANKVIPMLGHIALQSDNPGAARRAVFVLAQSRHPNAHDVIVDVAKTGPEPVRVAAVRELARFGGPDISHDLLQVYWTGGVPVKEQVVVSLGQRAEAEALLKIARSEKNVELRDTAVIAIGRAGGHEQLRAMYPKMPLSTRRAIIRALFTARDDGGLIRIAEQEKESALRAYARARLRLMGTAKARAYMERSKE